MARVAYGGGEWLDWFADKIQRAGTINSDATTPHDSGAGCLDFGSGATNCAIVASTETDGAATFNVDGRTYFARVWVRFGANPGALTRILSAWTTATSASVFSVDLDTSGRIVCPDGTTLSAALATATWHCVELKYNVTGTAGTWEVRVNGTSLGTGSLTAANKPDQIRFGNVNGAAHATTLRIDDWAVNNDQGSAQNTWAGTAGRVRVARPTSDNAVGSDWLLGSGAATAGAAWDAVNNQPPTGAATATGRIQDSTTTITNPTADADLNCQSYTAAGLPSGDTVTVLNALTAISNASSASTTVNAGLKQLSNPADAAETSGTTPVSGSTYPTNWKIVRSPFVHAPTVTPGTSPIVRVGKRTANAQGLRIAAVGVQFEYEPAATQTISPTAISSAEAFGSAAIDLRVNPGAIASAETFGTAALAQRVNPGAIGSAGAFGTPALAQRVNPGAIASAETFGVASISQPGLIVVAGLPSVEAFGTPTLDQLINAGAIASAEAFGAVALAQALNAGGIASAEAFGTPVLLLRVNAGAISSAEAFGTPAITEPGVIIVVNPLAGGQLRFQITTLRYPTVDPVVLAELEQFTNGQVGIPLNEGRDGKVTLSLYDAAFDRIARSRGQIDEYATMLRAFFDGTCVLWAPITAVKIDGSAATATVSASDKVRLENHEIVIGDEAIDKANPYGGRIPVDYRGLRLLRDAAINLPGQTARGVPDIGIFDGTNDQPNTDVFITIERGTEVWSAWTDLVSHGPSPGHEGAPDFELEPTVDTPGAYALLNTYTKQGDDVRQTVQFHFGFGRENLADYQSDSLGKFITHQHALGRGGHIRETRADLASSAERGLYVKWDALDYTGSEADIRIALAAWAQQQVDAYGVPVRVVTITLKPEDEIADPYARFRYLRNFKVGDEVTTEARRGFWSEQIDGRIVKVTLDQLDQGKKAVASLDLVPDAGGDGSGTEDD